MLNNTLNLEHWIIFQFIKTLLLYAMEKGNHKFWIRLERYVGYSTFIYGGNFIMLTALKISPTWWKNNIQWRTSTEPFLFALMACFYSIMCPLLNWFSFTFFWYYFLLWHFRHLNDVSPHNFKMICDINFTR